MKNFVSQNDIAYALKVKACREEVAMTNEELIERFLLGGIFGNKESYGFYAYDLALYSKAGIFPIAVKSSKNYFIITTTYAQDSDGWKKHVALTTKIAKQLGAKFVSSPHADAANFYKYMEEKINEILHTLANDLRTGSYISVPRYTNTDFPKPIFSNTNKPELCIAVPENYQKLMENIDALLMGERILNLPKNQVALLDTDEVQSLWRWLIKESPIKEERELLREMYMLSRLLGSPRREEEDKSAA